MSVSFSDIDAMLATRPKAADVPACAYGHVLNSLTDQGIELPETTLKALYALARIRQSPWPQIIHPRLAVFASAYADGAQATRAHMAELSKGTHAVARLCARANADLRVYELDADDNNTGMVLSEIEAAHALSYGLMTVEEKIDYLMVGSISAGHEAVLEQWMAVLDSDSQAHPLQTLCDVGGRHDLFALLGAVMAARMAGIPVGCGPALKEILDAVWPRFVGDEPHAVIPTTQTIHAQWVDADTIDALMTVLTLQNVAALVVMPSSANTVLPSAASSVNRVSAEQAA